MSIKRVKSYFQKKVLMELSLLQRLKVLGVILLFIGAGFFYHAVEVSSQEDPIASAPLLERSSEDFHPEDFLNFFILASIFVLLGLFCLYTARKKIQKLRSPPKKK